MRWLSYLSRVSGPVQQVRSVRIRARGELKAGRRIPSSNTPVREDPNPPQLAASTSGVKEHRSHVVVERVQKARSSAATPVDDGQESDSTGIGEADTTGDSHEAQTETPAGSPRVPNSLLEYWSDISAPTMEERIYANKFFTGKPKKMLFSAGEFYQVSFTDVPEIAIIGRSNVGKSTVVNALLGQKVAYTSNRPGKTRTLNAWAVGGMDRTGKHRLTVLDMPGYGHASAHEWGQAAMRYFQKRKELKRVFVMINAEHGLKSRDIAMLKALREIRVPHQVVLSKVDRAIDRRSKKDLTHQRLMRICGEINVRNSRYQLNPLLKELRDQKSEGYPAAMPDVIACSGKCYLPAEPPEPPGSLGITAFRWAILSAAGLQPLGKIRDQNELSFT